jgi:hypothetical protein
MATYFTRAEAEALLPTLDPILRELRDLRTRLALVQEELEALRGKMRGNGHGHQGEHARLRATAATLVANLNERIARITHMGVLVKDLEMGLIDFPAQREGQEILLCWRLDEPRIAWWHTLEGGFGARQPLDE